MRLIRDSNKTWNEPRFDKNRSDARKDDDGNLSRLPRSPDAADVRFLSKPFGTGRLLPQAFVARARCIITRCVVALSPRPDPKFSPSRPSQVLLESLIATIGMLVVAIGGCGQGSIGNALTGAKSATDQYTILLETFSSPQSHVQQSLLRKQQAESRTKLKGLLVVHQADHSELFCGRYPSIEAAQKTLKEAKQYFPLAILVPVPGAEIGPPEWKLENAQGLYTVVIADFYNDPECGFMQRQEAAVEYCKQLRDEGLEAYYYHGLSHSSVTVGAFPSTSVVTVSQDGQMLQKIVDERVTALLSRFPDLAVNGRQMTTIVRNPATGKADRKVAKSYLGDIPGKSGTNGKTSVDNSGHP